MNYQKGELFMTKIKIAPSFLSADFSKAGEEVTKITEDSKNNLIAKYIKK